MSGRMLKARVLSLVFVSIMLFGIIPQAVMAAEGMPKDGEQTKLGPFECYDLEKIYILYDPTDEILSAVADDVQEILSFRISGVTKQPVTSYSDLESYLVDGPWIAIYALKSNMQGIQFPDREMSWHQFYQVLREYAPTQHVVGMGNTLRLAPELTFRDSNIRHADSEQIDGMMLILYDVWTVADVIDMRAPIDSKYERAGKDIRAMAVKMYGDNMREMFMRTLDPANPIGEQDPVALEERTKEMWEKHAATIRPAAYRLVDNSTLEEVPLDALPEDFHPAIKLSSASELAADDYVLGEIPLFSALNGPIGDIIDILLKLLTDKDKSTISIPSDIIDTITEIFEVIEPVVGIVSNFDLDSPLKSVINALAKEFPFIDEFKDYLNIIAKALFNMRGDLSSILEIVTEIVFALLPDTIPGAVTDFLSEMLGVGSGLWDQLSEVISEGKGVYDVIFGFFTKNSLNAILNATLVAKIGIDAPDYLTRLVDFVTSFVDFLTTNDYSKFITDVGTDLLGSLLPSMSGLEAAVDKIMSVIEMGMTAVDLVDKFEASDMVQLVTNMLGTFVPEVVATAEDFARNLLEVIKYYKEAANGTLTAFRSQIEDIINEAVSGAVPQSTKDLIEEAITLIGGFYNGAFDKSQLPDIFEIAQAVIEELNLPPTQMGYHLSQETEFINAMNEVIRPIMGIIASVSESNDLKSLISKTPDIFDSELGGLPDMVKNAIEYIDIDDQLPSTAEVQEILDKASEIVGGVTNLIKYAKGQSFTGIMQSLLMTAGSLLGTLPSFDDVPFDAVLELLQSFFPKAFNIDPQNLPSPTEIVNEILSIVGDSLSGAIDIDMLRELLNFFMDIKGIFTDGVKWLLGMVFDWLSGLLNPLFDDLETTITSIFSGITDLLGYSATLPIGLGDWSLFDLTIAIGLRLNFAIDLTPLFDMISSMIFDARSTFSISNVGDFLKLIFSFFEITPQFFAEIGVSGFDSSKNAIMGTLLKSLGLELSFEGSAHFVLNLFTFRGGMFEWDQFMKIVEWGLHIKISLGKVFTLADILTAGLGGGALAAVMEFLGLDTIKITIWFAVELDIIKKAATAVAAEVSTLTLAITFGISIHIPLDLIILAIIIDGSLEIILTFFQDFASGDPLKITLRLIFTVKVTFRFLFFEEDGSWSWEPGGPWDLSPHKGEDEYNKSAVGFDTDDDGLSDEYEKEIPGLDWQKADTDGDGANDKLEVQTMDTDPVNPDTDSDGLTDGEEWDLGTNPMIEDTDWDDLTDYEEVKIYGTDPFSQDTDGDRLTDSYEIRTRWDLSKVTPTVEYVVIGGVRYDDHTDPLNPDTDGDTLLDGQEGPMGAYYGLDSLYNETEGSGCDPSPLIFNYGYTHPLDADTDDDSYLQLYNGDIDMMLQTKLAPKGTESQEYPMNDGAEVRGFSIILYDDEGEPYDKVCYTNPCNPDTDGDTGVSPEERENPPAGAWLNSDGYELQLDPPSDPTDGDSDDDGLIDGLEGVLRQDSNHTFYLDADSDDDGLPDMQDLLLGTDPLSPDTDLDMVSDGDEFYKYGTSPTLPDTDFDGLEDGEELFFWHSNPFSDDSDGDRLLDGYEVLVTGSDPMDEDSDNDGLTDYEEFFIYYTDPFVYDSDSDGLSDGEEIEVYFTDPLVWDTDHDSIWEPNELGDMTWPMSDYDEVKTWGTNATGTDSDMDGLGDAMELYLGGWTLYFSTSPYPTVPWLEPIPLDVLDNDTDDDFLLDGTELVLQNDSDLIYPFEAITIVQRFNTSPVDRDTDDDLLIDYQEVVVFNTNPANNDTDNDSISDWWEIWVYNTSALVSDTEGDGYYDPEETLTEIWPYGPWPPTNWSIGLPPGDNGTPGGYVPAGLMMDFELPPGRHNPAQTLYPTSATDWDSDDDWLPDGAEGLFYHSDPMDPDTDGDGISDTYEFDTDYDGLADGVEFKIGLQGTAGGGTMNPDSDLDGLLDGDEYYIYGTDPAKTDTDGDSYSDGLEIALGLDPLVFTPSEEFELNLAVARGQATMRIMLPKENAEVYQDQQVAVANFTPFQDVWFRYFNGSGWSGNYTATYSPAAGMFQSVGLTWSPGNITLQVFGKNETGIVSAAVAHFYVRAGETPFMWIPVAVAGAAVVGIVVVGYVGHKRGTWSRIRKRSGGGEKPAPEKESGETPPAEPEEAPKGTKRSKKGEAPKEDS